MHRHKQAPCCENGFFSMQLCNNYKRNCFENKTMYLSDDIFLFIDSITAVRKFCYRDHISQALLR